MSWRAIDGPVCVACGETRSRVAATRAAAVYEGRLRGVIHAFKYEGRRSLAAPLGRLIRDAGGSLISEAACAVPVPLHPWRRLGRGFNQAAALATQLGLPVVHAVWRLRATRAQAGLSAPERRRNLHGAFAISPLLLRRHRNAFVRGRTVLLVDDVRTTGATLEACADVLHRTGARRVVAVAVAWAGKMGSGVI